MAEIKWIKITTNMFDDEKIKLIDAMPERDTIFYIWMRLLVQAGKTNAGGYIFLTENVPYTEEMLSTIFSRPLNSVRLALQTLKSFRMIDIAENHLIKISNWEKHQNIEGMEKVREQNRLRKQKQRRNQKQLTATSKQEITGTKEGRHSMSRDSHAIEVEGEVDIEVDNTTTGTNENLHVDNYIDFFNNNMGHLITPFEIEMLQSYIDDGMNKEVITMALQEAVEADKRDVRYVKTVLNRWLENKITTVEAVMIDKRNFEDKKKKNEAKKQYTKSTKKESTFNNFTQREYDFEDLEKKLLGWGD